MQTGQHQTMGIGDIRVRVTHETGQDYLLFQAQGFDLLFQ